MVDKPGCGHAESEESEGPAPILPRRPENRAPLSDSRLAGAIIRFEQVRGRGDGEIARLAELQHGHVHIQQLRAAGLRRGAVAHRVAMGRLHLTLPGVYLVGRPQRDVLGRMMAAALYFRGDALVSGAAAAQLWGSLDATQQLDDRDPIRMLLLGRNTTTPSGISVHRTSSLARQDVRWRHGIPLTSPARTILDLAGAMDELELEAALSIATGSNLVRVSQLRDVMQRNPRAKGIGKLRALLEQTEPLHDTRSKYERRFLRLLKAAELPLPQTNVWIGRRWVDGLWPDLSLVLEIDGYHGIHGKRDKFESDRVRDQHLMIAGQRVMRVTARQIDHAPYALVARTASIITTLRLGGQGSPPAARPPG